MEEFYQQFKDHLENRPEPPFDARAWKQMERKLDATESTKKRGAIAWWWLAAAVLLLPSLVLNTWFLVNRPATTPAGTSQLYVDTLIKTQTILRTDTIYRTQVIKEVVYRAATQMDVTATTAQNNALNRPVNNQDQPLLGRLFRAEHFSVALLPEEPTWPLSDARQQRAAAQAATANPVGTSWHKELPMLPRLMMQSLTYKPASITTTIVLPPDGKKKQHLLALQYALRPKGIEVGVQGGLAQPIHAKLQAEKGYALGLKAAVVFSPAIQLWAEGQFQRLYYNVNRMDADLGIPAITPPSDNLSFKYADVVQPVFQFGAGLRYNFSPAKAWQPFIALGLGSARQLSYEVDYEFEDAQQGIEWSVKRDIQGQDLHHTFALGKFGYQLAISKQFSWQLSAQYQRDFSARHSPLDGLFGLQTGFTFKL